MSEPIPRLKRAAKEAGCSSALKILNPGESISLYGSDPVEIVENL
jgi:hypothetical protein